MNIVAYKIDLVHRKYKKFGKNLIAKIIIMDLLKNYIPNVYILSAT